MISEHKEESEVNVISTQCLKCDQDYEDEENLTQHVFQVHWRKCAICLSSFENLNEYSKHLEVDHSLICYACITCDIVFKSLLDKKEHMKNCTERYQCFYCSKDLSFQTFLWHIRHGHKGHFKQPRYTKVEKSFICKICNGEYKSKQCLKLHIARMHDKSLYLTCHLCGVTVTGKSALNMHIKCVHEKIKDFQCDQCEKKFSAGSGLRKHKTRVHEGGIYKMY